MNKSIITCNKEWNACTLRCNCEHYGTLIDNKTVQLTEYSAFDYGWEVTTHEQLSQ